MKEIDSTISNIYESKKSKFISFLYPYINTSKDDENFYIFKNDIINSLKLEHKKAAHFCYAFRFLNQNNQLVEGNSDDKEPKGSAGLPILNVIAGKDLINILSICVRYFGGIKLGIGGLVRAYGSSTIAAIQKAEDNNLIREYKNLETLKLQDKINNFNLLAYTVKKYNLTISQKCFKNEIVSLEIIGDQTSCESFLHEIKNLDKFSQIVIKRY